MTHDPTTRSLLDPESELAGLRRAARRISVDPSTVSLPRRRYVESGSLRLSYLDWSCSAAQAATIVFLHGGRLTAHAWDLVCLGLRDTYRCIALDLRGHGESAWSPDARYEVAAYSADVAALVARENPQSFGIVGHSLGGVVAAHFASRAPRALNAIAIVDAGPHARSNIESVRIREFASETENARTLDDFVAEAIAFNPRRDPTSLRHSLLHNLRPRSDGALAWKYDPAPYEIARAADRQLDHARVWERVEGIAVPALLVRGGASATLTPDEARELAGRLPRGRLATVEGAGHSVQGDRPQELTVVLRDFFSSVLPARSPGR